jgi:hypothetical protein
MRVEFNDFFFNEQLGQGTVNSDQLSVGSGSGQSLSVTKSTLIPNKALFIRHAMSWKHGMS